MGLIGVVLWILNLIGLACLIGLLLFVFIAVVIVLTCVEG